MAGTATHTKGSRQHILVGEKLATQHSQQSRCPTGQGPQVPPGLLLTRTDVQFKLGSKLRLQS